MEFINDAQVFQPHFGLTQHVKESFLIPQNGLKNVLHFSLRNLDSKCLFPTKTPTKRVISYLATYAEEQTLIL